jgi:hypothetical protein
MLTALGTTFLATMVLGVPIAFCLGLAGLVSMLVWGKTSLILIPQRMFTGVDSFVLMAVPLFMLAGELMGTSGIITRMVRFADILVGGIRGGLAHVNIVSAMILSGVSGSAVADASALGSTLIPAMREARAVRSPDDLRGLKFRVMENPVYVSLFRNLGSSAVPIPFGEVYGAIQTGVVDGAEIPVNVTYANKMYEQAKHMALTRHTYTPTPFIANVAFLQKLPSDDQRSVTQAARDAAAAQRALIDQRTNEFIELLKKQGMQVTEVDTAAFRAKAAPVYKEFEARIGKELLDEVLRSK